MSNLLITPILSHYNFFDKLCDEAATILSLDLSDASRYQQFRLSVFINFNRYLVDSLLFCPGEEAEDLLGKLNLAMETANETETLNILNNQLDFFPEIRSGFLNIITILKK